MSLTLALNTALTSLNVNQRSLATLSQNIANANNPEYSRQIVNQEAVYLTGQGGAGVRIRDVNRKVDDFLQSSVRNQQSNVGKTSVLADYTDRLQVLLGKPGSNNSIYSYTTSFFNALQSLAQTPENASLRVNAVNLAQTATREMNNLANGIYEMQFSADQDIRQAVDVINASSRAIYTLNGTIASNKLLGRPTSDLEDRRDAELNKIAQLVDVQTYLQSNGKLNVFTAGGNSLVDDNLFEVSYIPTASSTAFSNNNPTAAIQVYRLDENGLRTGTPSTLVSAGTRSDVTTSLVGGKIKGLVDLRDRQLPDVIAKLDMLASTMRDEMNKVHNAGIAYPGANSYTGTRAVAADDYSQWSGKVRIGIVGPDGKPVPSSYSDEQNGLRPITIDFDTLDTGQGTGYASVQGIINEINYTYGVPGNKVELGALNDIRLVLNNDTIPGATPQLDFDFQLDNISGADAKFFVTDVQVFNDSNTNITSLTQDVPTLALASTGTYVTQPNSQTVTVKTSAEHGYKNGDVVYLTPPSSAVDGIPADSLGGFFTISNVSEDGFNISVNQPADTGGTFSDSTAEVRPAYSTAETGTTSRTKTDGTITANLAGNTTSSYYTVKANVSVVNADGTVSSSIVTYRIDNLQTNVRNYRFAAQSATGSGVIVASNTTKPAMRAVLVDANGNEMPISNNMYSTNQKGYLKLITDNGSYSVAIDSLNSKEVGQPNSVPPKAGTNRSFSHYFELNNLFTGNRSTGVADDVVGSAKNMSVSQVLVKNPNLLSLGSYTQSPLPVDPDLPPTYTYERTIGDNSIIDQLARFATTTVSFGAAGDLGANSQTLTSYAGQMISTVSTRASTNKSDMDNANVLLDGFTTRADAVRGVNLDEELANTIIYQNAYSASARIITVANEFFDALMNTIR